MNMTSEILTSEDEDKRRALETATASRTYGLLVRGLTMIAARACACGRRYDRLRNADCPGCNAPNPVAASLATLDAGGRDFVGRALLAASEVRTTVSAVIQRQPAGSVSAPVRRCLPLALRVDPPWMNKFRDYLVHMAADEAAKKPAAKPRLYGLQPDGTMYPPRPVNYFER